MEQTKTKEKNREIDMLHGKLAGKLIMFALPLAFSTILQQLFNSADVAVVGRFAGSSALAAVGSSVALVGIFVNLITGLSVGPNAALANLIGQNKREQISAMLHHCKAGSCGVRNAGQRHGSGDAVYPYLSFEYSIYAALQFWCGGSAKLRRQQTSDVLSFTGRCGKRCTESSFGSRRSFGRGRCCHRYAGI